MGSGIPCLFVTEYPSVANRRGVPLQILLIGNAEAIAIEINMRPPK